MSLVMRIFAVYSRQTAEDDKAYLHESTVCLEEAMLRFHANAQLDQVNHARQLLQMSAHNGER
jgi:hypothetical protein